MGTRLPAQKRGHSHQFSAHVYCGQPAGWIKMALGTEVGLCPDDIVLDGGGLPFLGGVVPIQHNVCWMWTHPSQIREHLTVPYVAFGVNTLKDRLLSAEAILTLAQCA